MERISKTLIAIALCWFVVPFIILGVLLFLLVLPWLVFIDPDIMEGNNITIFGRKIGV